jgi:hypothetical protein
LAITRYICLTGEAEKIELVNYNIEDLGEIPDQIVSDAMLTEEADFYMASEDEANVYLQLEEV